MTVRIPSQDIPQADTLSDVVAVVRAVGLGAKSDAQIAAAISKVSRQGRYYRRAAEILGFIANDRGANRSTLTKDGRRLLGATDHSEQLRILTSAILSARMFQRVIPLLEANSRTGISREQLSKFIADVTEPVGPTMIPRRVATVSNWLTTIGLLKYVGGRYFMGPVPQVLYPVEYGEVDEPLTIPKGGYLQIYQDAAEATRVAGEAIQVLIDRAARERANANHGRLIKLVAQKLRAAGAIPRYNRYIDLSAAVQEIPFLFEMKSNGSQTFHVQLRRAISQLYEYRYMQRAQSAKLVVVMQQGPLRRDQWLIDYVLKDRGLLIAWNGDGDRLHIPTEVLPELAFLQ